MKTNSAIARGWSRGTFGQLAEIEMGQSPPGSSYNVDGVGIPLINGPTEFTERHPVARQWTTEPTKVCRDRDILLCVRGSSTGRLNTATGSYCIGRGVAAIRAAQPGGSTDFVHLVLQSVTAKLLSLTNGSTFPNIDRDSLSSIPILLPPLPEQRKIAEILGTWDEAIALVERRLAAACARKQGLMQRLLTGQVRFPGFTEPWREVRLGEVATVNAEQLGESTAPDARFRYIELSAVSEGEISLSDEPEPFSALPSRARRILHRNDVIMATVRPYLRGFALCDFDSDHIICSTGFALLSPKDLHDGEFIYQSLYSDALLGQMQGRVTGSNYPALNASDVAALQLAWPADDTERWCVAAVLIACDDEVGLLSRKLAALQAQKKGLMQRLLTGEVRVGV